MMVDLDKRSPEGPTVRCALSVAEARALADSLDCVMLDRPLLALRSCLRGVLAEAAASPASPS